MIVEELFIDYLDVCANMRKQPTEDVLLVSIGEQKLYHYRKKMLHRTYPVSTSLRPPSCVENSLGTPLGLHCIREKLGKGAPQGAVFKGRRQVIGHYSECSEEDQKRNLVTTRILWLQGLESGRNAGPGCDSFQRYIYIHGTNHEEKLGQPASAGCIQLGNAAVIKLFNEVPTDSHVWLAAD